MHYLASRLLSLTLEHQQNIIFQPFIIYSIRRERTRKIIITFGVRRAVCCLFVSASAAATLDIIAERNKNGPCLYLFLHV